MFETNTMSSLYAKCYESTPQNQNLTELLQEEVVESCIIQNQTISDADFSNTRFRRVIFQNCCLLNCSFAGCELIETRLINCDLSGSVFDLSVWNQTMAWLTTGINIQNATLCNAVFEDCEFSSNNFYKCSSESVEIYKGSM